MTAGWQRVVFAADCDEDGNCPHCGIDYTDCPCPGPSQEDDFDYKEVRGVTYARRKQPAPAIDELSLIMDKPRRQRSYRRACNAKAWAIGTERRNGFMVRRVVWGRLLAREEKRPGETIHAAVILIRIEK